MLTSIADFAAQVQDGALGLIETVSIGDVTVSALMALDGSDELDITSHRIEDGMEITYAAVDVPTKRSLTICLANPDFSIESGLDSVLTGNFSGFTDTWRDKRDKIYEYKDNRELITVSTHERVYENMMIRSITPLWDVDNNFDCFFATVVVKQLTISSSAQTGIFDAAKSALGGL